MEKQEFLERIKANINEHGYHVTIVTGGPCPRYLYTIGLANKIGCEFVFAGGEGFSVETLNKVIYNTYKHFDVNGAINKKVVDYSQLDHTSIAEVDPSWSRFLMLGVFDFYETNEIKAYQILPALPDRTLDVPDLSKEFSVDKEPIWKWLTASWPYAVPKGSIAVTNLASLHGQKITEATRWEEDEWELFTGAGSDIEKDDLCMVPLGTLLGIDATIEPITNLRIGKGVWRDPSDLVWHEWN